jgi:hypothetical protein
MKTLAFIPLLLLSSQLFAQDEEEEKPLKHLIGIEPLTYESNFQINSRQHNPKLKVGFFYENRFHPNFSLRTELGFASNIINDYGPGFFPASGKMLLVEFQTGIGLRYIMNGSTDWPIKFYLETNFYYNGSNYSGIYYSPQVTNLSTNFDESYHVAGTRIGLGFDLFLKDNVNMTFGYFLRPEVAWGNTDIVYASTSSAQDDILGQSDFGFYPLQGSAVIRIGYLF